MSQFARSGVERPSPRHIFGTQPVLLWRGTMLDGKRLLESFLGAGRGGGGSAGTPAGKGGLGDLLQGVGGGGARGHLGGLGSGAAIGGLAALLLGTKSGRSLGGSALKLGALAGLGGLAYKAWQDYQAGQQPGREQKLADAIEPPPSGTDFLPDDPTAESTRGLTLVRAMIAAAKADGHIDADERSRIMSQLEAAGSDQEVNAFLFEELAKPLDVDAIAAEATTPAIASEIYAASLFAIDPDREVERAYLRTLAEKMRLDPALVAHLESKVAAADRLG